ncbi:MAG: YifB family Mg chelatase-like AAA ATPase, partial [Caulobacteraceae bacterium]
IEGAQLDALATLDGPGRALMTRASEAGGLSARGWSRALRVARTIADLEGAGQVRRVHLAEALAYRTRSWASQATAQEPRGALVS